MRTGSPIQALETPALRASWCRDDPRLAVRAFGLNFPNPVGMAAGFDKHAEVPDALLRLGFGFVEIGTVTPQPQVGNPRPRVFRLDADEGVINRLGFNSDGADAVLRRLAARANRGGIVGVNVGANKDAADRIADYVPHDRDLRAGRELFHRQHFLAEHAGTARTAAGQDVRRTAGARDGCARPHERQAAGTTPVLIKIAPDLTLSELDDIVGGARRHTASMA